MRRRGFTLIELVVVLCLVGLLTALAARRLLALRVEAERAALFGVVGSLQAAVSMQGLSLLSAGRDAELARLPGSNPMDYVLEPPWSYLGELDGPDPQSVSPGRWYFDRREGLLVYRVRHAQHFATSLPGPARARFAVRLLFDDRDGNGRFDPGVDGVGGARLEAAEPGGWLRDDPAPDRPPLTFSERTPIRSGGVWPPRPAGASFAATSPPGFRGEEHGTPGP